MENAPDDPNNSNREKDGRINFWKELWSQMFDPKKNQEAIGSESAAQAPFEKFSEELNKKIEQLKFNLEHPSLQKTGDEFNNDAASKKGKREKKTDSLIEVGNFLGSDSSGSLIPQLQLDVQRQSLEAHRKLVEQQAAEIALLGLINLAVSRNKASQDLGIDFGG